MTATATTPELLRYLADSVPWLAHRKDEAEDAFDELDTITGLVVQAIDTRDPGAYAGPCDVCGLDMYAKPGKSIATCRQCGLDYDFEPRRRKLLEKANGRLLSVPDLARAFTGVGLTLTQERLRTWIKRDQLLPAGKTLRGDPLYRVKDVQKILEQGPAKAKRETA